MDIDNTRTHVSVGEQQRVRGERIIDIAVCVERALPVAPLAHLEARAGADNGERGGAAGTAPAAGNAEHPRDLKQIHDAAEHTRTERHANRQSEHSNERVEDARRGLKNGAHRRGLKDGIVGRRPPI